MDLIDKKESLRKIFPKEMQELFYNCIEEYDKLTEIRIRINQPTIIYIREEELFLTETGLFSKNVKLAKRMNQFEIEAILNQVCDHSPYAFEQELANGYITVPGGHRIGVLGERIQNVTGAFRMKHIGFLNIRIAHEVIGCSNDLIEKLFEDANFLSTMIVSPPGVGKTTMLRDLIRQVSDGCKYTSGMKVGLVDERSEIAGCYQGVPQNLVGMRTDVLDGCDKANGIMILLKSMSPQIIAVDEIASDKDVDVLERAAGCGCKFLVTIHGTIESIRKKTTIKRLFSAGLIEQLIVLNKKNGIRSYDLIAERGEWL